MLNVFIGVLKIDENRCKQTLASYSFTKLNWHS